MEQNLFQKGRILALKMFAEAYLLNQGNNKTEELFAEREINESTTLSGGEVFVLHHWLMEEFKAIGLDLEQVIVQNGETVEENKLSNYEINELIRRADQLLVQLSVFKEYLKANGKI